MTTVTIFWCRQCKICCEVKANVGMNKTPDCPYHLRKAIWDSKSYVEVVENPPEVMDKIHELRGD